jgi:hypothetical protein
MLFAPATQAATIAYWDFDGNANDATGNGYNLDRKVDTGSAYTGVTIVNSVPNPDPAADAANGDSLLTNDASYATGQDSTGVGPWQLGPNSSFTMEMWAQSFGPGFVVTNRGKGTGGTDGGSEKLDGWGLRMVNTGGKDLKVQANGPSGNTEVAQTFTSVNFGNRNHIALVWDHDAATDGELRLYVEGSLEGTIAGHSGWTSPFGGALSFGARELNGDDGFDETQWGGRIDEARFSDEALAPGAFLVPEPAAMTLMVAGGLAMFSRRRRCA